MVKICPTVSSIFTSVFSTAGRRRRGAFCSGPDTDTYTSMKFSPKTIDYTLQKRCTIHYSPLQKKVQKALVQSTKRCKEVHFLCQKEGGYCMCPRRSDARKNNLYKHAWPNNSGMKYYNSLQYRISVFVRHVRLKPMPEHTLRHPIQIPMEIWDMQKFTGYGKLSEGQIS